MILSYKAEEKDIGRKVISVLRREFEFSSTLIKRLKFSGGVFLNGAAVFTDVILNPGDIVSADTLAGESAAEVPIEHGDLDILYENDAIIAVSKPAGMLVHPSRSKYAGTLMGLILGHLKDNGQPPVCHAVNRLDRDTSGVVLFSKDSHFKNLAARALSESGAHKEYIAAVYGAPKKYAGIIDLPIGRPDESSMKRCVMSSGQPAKTAYETLATKNIEGFLVSLLRLQLFTGRTHQIRAHMAHIGCPILGDFLYGTEKSTALSENLGFSTHLLHAEKLSFEDPLTKLQVSITAPALRPDFMTLGFDFLKFFHNE